MSTTANHFYAAIFTRVDQAIDTFLTSTIAEVAGAVGPIANKMLFLYVLLWGIAAYRGLIQEYIVDGVVRIVKVILVISLATNVGLYSGTIADNLIALPDYLAKMVGGGSPTADSKATLDKILDDGLETAGKFWESASLNPLNPNISPIFMAVFTLIAIFLSTGYAAFLIVLSKLALAVLVGIGPLFIIMLMFDSTKKFFESWVGQVMNFAFVSFLTVAVVKLIFAVLESTATSTNTATTAAVAGGSAGLWTIASLILISLIGFLVLMQVMGIASGLGGGMALSTMGAAGAAMGAAGRFAGGLNKRKTDRERKDPTTWTSKAGTAMRNKAGAAWANRKKTNSIKNAS